jgi:hypothetical protein
MTEWYTHRDVKFLKCKSVVLTEWYTHRDVKFLKCKSVILTEFAVFYQIWKEI